MNPEFLKLLTFLPAPPDYAWNWRGISACSLSPLLSAMAETGQNPVWHGEGDVWTHTKLVCDALASLPEYRELPERRRQILALAALLHDVAKSWCTKLEGGALISPGHGSAGAQRARSLLWQDFDLCGTSDDQSFREAVCLLIQHHGLPMHLLERENPSLIAMKLAANGALIPDFTLDMLFTLSKADALGRIAGDVPELLESISLSRELAQEAECLMAPFPFPSDVTLRACLDGRSVWPRQELYDDSWGEVILLAGLPGTGKDTWIRSNYPDLPTVCLDDIRRSMGVKPTDNQGAVIQAAREQARQFLRAKRPFIWNATSLTASLRQNQVGLFESYGAAARIIYLETPWQENLRRNADRGHVVPENVITRMLNKLTPPERFEARRVEWICT